MDVENQLEQFCMHCGHKIVYLAHQAGSNVFCPKCGQSVQIQADASNPVKAEPSQVVATSSDIMPPADVHLSIEGQQYGPYTEAEIQGHLKTGQVAPTTLAQREGMSGWLPLNELLQPALEPAVAQPIATNPQATIATSADPQPEVPVSADIDDEAFKCMECGKAFKYQGSLENHQKSKRHGNYQQFSEDSIEADLESTPQAEGWEWWQYAGVAAILILLISSLGDAKKKKSPDNTNMLLMKMKKGVGSRQQQPVMPPMPKMPKSGLGSSPTMKDFESIMNTPETKPSVSQDDLAKATEIVEDYNEIVANINKGSSVVLKMESELPRMRLTTGPETIAKIENTITNYKINVKGLKDTCRNMGFKIKKLAPGKFRIPNQPSIGLWKPIVRR